MFLVNLLNLEFRFALTYRRFIFYKYIYEHFVRFESVLILNSVLIGLFFFFKRETKSPPVCPLVIFNSILDLLIDLIRYPLPSKARYC